MFGKRDVYIYVYIYIHIFIYIYDRTYLLDVGVRVVPGHRNWQIETAAWNLASFLHFFKKPAGSDLGSFLMIYRNLTNIEYLEKT